MTKRLSSKKKVLVFAFADSGKSPRVNRAINGLQKSFDVSYLGFYSGHPHLPFYEVKRKRGIFNRCIRLTARLFRLHRMNEQSSYSLPKKFSFDNFDVVLCHDLEGLPYIYRSGYNGKVILDAREYYPRHFEHSGIWRFMHGPFQHYLCRTFLNKPDHAVTVSEGLSKEYFRNYSVKMDTLYSLPDYQALSPKIEDDKLPIRVVHHGNASPQRQIETMIEAVRGLEGSIALDLMLVGNGPYMSHLKQLAANTQNVKIIPPVPLKKIVDTLVGYDVGLIFFPATTFNLEHCMPNKLFECMQARLCLVCAPLEDMKNFVRENNAGIVCGQNNAEALRDTLMQLDRKTINYYKQRSDKLSQTYNQKTNDEKLTKLINQATLPQGT